MDERCDNTDDGGGLSDSLGSDANSSPTASLCSRGGRCTADMRRELERQKEALKDILAALAGGEDVETNSLIAAEMAKNALEAVASRLKCLDEVTPEEPSSTAFVIQSALFREDTDAVGGSAPESSNASSTYISDSSLEAQRFGPPSRRRASADDDASTGEGESAGEGASIVGLGDSSTPQNETNLEATPSPTDIAFPSSSSDSDDEDSLTAIQEAASSPRKRRRGVRRALGTRRVFKCYRTLCFQHAVIETLLVRALLQLMPKTLEKSFVKKVMMRIRHQVGLLLSCESSCVPHTAVMTTATSSSRSLASNEGNTKEALGDHKADDVAHSHTLVGSDRRRAEDLLSFRINVTGVLRSCWLRCVAHLPFYSQLHARALSWAADHQNFMHLIRCLWLGFTSVISVVWFLLKVLFVVALVRATIFGSQENSRCPPRLECPNGYHLTCYLNRTIV